MATLPSRVEMQRARLERDGSYDGVFWVGVTTTGIFCRPSCPARTPLEAHVVYLTSPDEAAKKGLRPCARCHPLATDGRAPDWVARVMDLVARRAGDRITDADLRTAGSSPSRVRRYFLAHHGVTFHAYVRAQRLGGALTRLRQGAGVLDAGLEHGFESASGFHEAFRRTFNATPGASAVVQPIVVCSIASPIGPLEIGATQTGICLLEFADRRALPTELSSLRKELGRPIVPGTNVHTDSMTRELELYFAHRLTTFETPLDLVGTPFQMTVWNALRQIAYGTTLSYGELAARVGRPGASRAVARANGQNRVAIVVPCHRVIQSDGALAGYGGGVHRKRYLLDLEAGQSSFPSAEDLPGAHRARGFSG